MADERVPIFVDAVLCCVALLWFRSVGVRHGLSKRLGNERKRRYGARWRCTTRSEEEKNKEEAERV